MNVNIPVVLEQSLNHQTYGSGFQNVDAQTLFVHVPPAVHIA
jgi:hypothetical protein